ncbi:MAG: gadC 1 [Gammaproteobacteria bacterium]|jgi:amino acid transporter|nr:gadC 1 [Gammaproteobacteria bacterium]
MMKLTQLSVFTLAMLITGAIDSIRNLPATALFGSTLIFFFTFAAIVFLIPTALVSAEMSATWTEDSGVYNWVKMAFGEKWAFFAIWLQWINTMVWYPTILSFIAGTLAFLVDPALAEHRWYLVTIILSVFWLLTFLNLRGLHTSARFATWCTIVGMVIPMAIIMILAGVWLWMGNPSQIEITTHTVLPSFTHTNSWISLTAIMAAFLGMELATVHVKDIEDPQAKFPKAMLLSVVIIVITMVCGALSIAMVMPAQEINLVGGVMQAFQQFFTRYHMPWMTGVLTIMLIIGSLGGMINWIISPAKGLLHAGERGYLPPLLIQKNKQGVAVNLLILQAILVSGVCLVFLLMPSVNGSYWLLTALSTQLYMLMYILMFMAAFVLRKRHPHKVSSFKIPGGLAGMGLITVLGIVGCIITLCVGFFPPEGIDVGSFWHYEMIFSLGIVAMIIPVGFFYAYKARSKGAAQLVQN